MKIIKLIIDEEQNGKKIKYLLRNHLGLSAATVKKLKNSHDGIMLEGKRVFVTEQVISGQQLVLTIRDEVSENIEPVPMELDILYEDEDVIVVNKPGNMPTHPSQNHHGDTLANGIMYYFRDRSFTFRVITRLDKDTSGVVLIAKNAFSAQRLSDDIKNKRIQKLYVAAVNGCPENPCGRIDAPIKRVDNSAILRCVSAEGKDAVSEYKVIQSRDGVSYVELRPLTGRTHQLRVHMSYLGVPIYGDDMYGAPQKDQRTRLHCRTVEFVHPSENRLVTVSAPVPEDIKNLF